MPLTTAAWLYVLAFAPIALVTVSSGSVRCAAVSPFVCVQPEVRPAPGGNCFTIQPHPRRDPDRAGGSFLKRLPPEPGMPWLFPPGSPPKVPLVALPVVSLPRLLFAAAAKPVRESLPVQSPAAAVLPSSLSIPLWQRGYALGFAMAVLLAVLWVAGIMLLVRGLLRRPVPVAPGHIAVALPVRQPSSPVIHTIRPISRPVVHVAKAARPFVVTSAGWPEEDDHDLPHRCALLLRRAGWDATVFASAGSSRADVVARRDGRVLALRCLPLAATLDDEAVEDACMARERERADLVAIVSEASGTAGAKKLAAEAGIELLRQGGLRDFAR